MTTQIIAGCTLAAALARPSDSDRLAGISRAVDALEAELTSPTIDEMVGLYGFAACTDPDGELSAMMREEGKTL